MADNGYLTTREAADYLRVTIITIYKWAKEGSIGSQPHKNAHWRFTRKELDSFVRGKGND